jgi:hypothetical protein
MVNHEKSTKESWFVERPAMMTKEAIITTIKN